MVYIEQEVIRDYETMDLGEFEEKYKIRTMLHDWTIEHFRGDNLPIEYSIHEAFKDDKYFAENDDEYPEDMTPPQLYSEVITMIIEADGGQPF